MSKHTPLTYIAHQDGYFLVKQGHKSGDSKIGEIYSQDNIEQIVSRVNLHDDLVEALTNLRREYCQAECYGNDYGRNWVKHKNYCLAASKTLAKAKGEK